MKKTAIVLFVAMMLGVMSILTSCVGDYTGSDMTGESETSATTQESTTTDEQESTTETSEETTVEEQESSTDEDTSANEELKKEQEISAIVTFVNSIASAPSGLLPGGDEITLPELDLDELMKKPASVSMFLTAEQIAAVVEALKQFELEGTVEAGDQKAYFGMKNGIIAIQMQEGEKVENGFIKVSDDLSKIGFATIDENNTCEGNVYKLESEQIWEGIAALKESISSVAGEGALGIKLPELKAEQVVYDEENNVYVIDNAYFTDLLFEIVKNAGEADAEISSAEIAAMKAYLEETINALNFKVSIAFDDKSMISCVNITIDGNVPQDPENSIKGNYTITYTDGKLTVVDFNIKNVIKDANGEELTLDSKMNLTYVYAEDMLIGCTFNMSVPTVEYIYDTDDEGNMIATVNTKYTTVNAGVDFTKLASGGVIVDFELEEKSDSETTVYTFRVSFVKETSSCVAVFTVNFNGTEVNKITVTLSPSAENFPEISNEVMGILDGEAVGNIDDFFGDQDDSSSIE